jgi:hypothetical protein
MQLEEQGRRSNSLILKLLARKISNDEKAAMASEVRKIAPRLERSGKASGLLAKREDIRVRRNDFRERIGSILKKKQAHLQ